MKRSLLSVLLVLFGATYVLAGDSGSDVSQLLQKQGFVAVSMMNNHGDFEITAHVDDRQNMRLLVDTGCDITTFDAALMNKLKYRLQQANKTNTLGGSMEQQTTIVESIRLGDLTVGPAIVGCMTLEHINKSRREHHIPTIDGILGMDLMTKHGAIIDVTKSILYLKKE